MSERRPKQSKSAGKTKKTADFVHDAGVSVQLGAPFLIRAEFERLKDEASHDELAEAAQVGLRFALARFSREQIAVELEVKSHESTAVRFDVAYRGVFQLLGGGKDTDFDQELRLVVAVVATSTLYPFLRETVTSLAQRSGMPGLTLPLVNFRELIDPATIALPPVQELGAGPAPKVEE